MPLDGRVNQAPRGIRDLVCEADQSIASMMKMWDQETHSPLGSIAISVMASFSISEAVLVSLGSSLKELRSGL